MKSMPEAVTVKFNELFVVVNHTMDDLKLEAADANMEGDFGKVASLNEGCRKLQMLESEIKLAISKFPRDLNHKGTENNRAKTGNHRKRKPASRISVTVMDKVIEERTIAETFVKALRIFGLERVAKLNKVVSAVPLLSKMPVTGYQTQKRCDGWFITTHVNKRNATELLEEIGRALNVPVKVESIAL